jgi:hypothetical protein
LGFEAFIGFRIHRDGEGAGARHFGYLKIVLADAAKLKQTDTPAWAVIPGAGSDGLAEVDVLYPNSAALGTILSAEMERNTYYVGCGTSFETTNKPYPAILLKVLPG